MQKRGKKGLSTIVITLIIILISLVAVGIILVVVRNVIQSGTEGIALGQFTLGADIINVNVDNSSNNVSLSVKRSSGEGEITGIKFIFSDETDSEIITEKISINKLEEKRFTFHLTKLAVSKLISISIVLASSSGKETLGSVLSKYNVQEGTSTAGGTGNQTCTPNCAGKVCGNDGCGGSCPPGCGTGYTCNSTGNCVADITYTETFYVCQGGDGSAPESGNCATAWDADDAYNSGNWNTAVATNDGKIGPGDRIYFMSNGGTITGTGALGVIKIWSSGTLTNRITLEGDGSAVIDGQNKSVVIEAQNNKNYITIKNLELKHGANFTISFYACNNWIIENNTVWGVNATVLHKGTNIGGCGDNHLIQYNDIHTNYGQYGEHGIYIYSCTGPYGSDNNIIQYNYIHDSKGAGIHFNGVDVQFIGNIIRYNLIEDSGWGDISSQTGDGTEIYGNIFYHTALSKWIGIYLGDDSIGTAHAMNNKVWNNVFYGYFEGMIYMSGPQGIPGISELYNNIFYSTGGACSSGATCSDQNYIDYIASDAVIAASDNNLFYSTASAKWKLANGTKLNFASWKAVNPGFDTHSLEINPLLVNPGVDFSLQATSPCINAGKNLVGHNSYVLNPSVLKSNFGRGGKFSLSDQNSYGTGWEIGAYVYS